MSRRLAVAALAVALGLGAWLVLHGASGPALTGPGARGLLALVHAARPHGSEAAALALLAGGAGAVALGVPRLAVYALAGAGWGLVGGFVLAHVASTAGALVDYAAGRAWATRVRPIQRLAGLDGGWTDVFLARQLPVPGTAVSMVLGAQRVPLRAFVAGTVLGFVPQGAAAALGGSGWQTGAVLPATARVGAAALGLVALGVLGRACARHLARAQPTAQALARGCPPPTS